MKDVTVALELTLPMGVSDQQIKSFVEEAIKEHLDRLRKEHFYDTSKVDWKETSWTSIQWAQLEILGVDEHLIDVVAIKDGYFYREQVGIETETRGPEFRDLTTK
jgi:hypothetical protein